MDKMFPVYLTTLADQWEMRSSHMDGFVDMMGGRYLKSDLLQSVANGGFLLFGVMRDDRVMDITIMASVVKYPQKKALIIHGLHGSDMMEWLDIARDGIHSLAKSLGCEIIEARGRKGWGKIVNGYPIKYDRFFEAEVI